MFCDQAAEERIFKESEMRIISERNNKNSRTYFPLHHHHHWWSLHHIRHVDPELVPQRHRPGKIFTDTNIIQYLQTHQHAQKDTVLMTKSRSISTVEGSGATCTRNFFELFFQNRWSFYGPVDPKNSKNFKKMKKTPKMHWHHTTQMVMETLVTSG